jgi:phosphatidate cytidylyltransferase
MKRLVTALLLAPAVVYLVIWSPDLALFAAVLIVASLCYFEYQGIAKVIGLDTFGPLGYVAGILLFIPPVDAKLTLVLATLMAMSLSLRTVSLAQALSRSAVFLLGVVYVFGTWSTVPPLRAMSPHWLMFALALNWAGDTGAYYIGRALGKHKLAPRISPGKTWEGAIGSVLSSMIFGLVYIHLVLPEVPLWQVAVLSLAGNVAGQFGDLAESALKRGAGVKDSSHLLPGHGGWLDRVDSSMFAMPVVYGLLTVLRGW